MAIIQISKIQVRTGNIVDLPQLDEGEFGWASDTKKLYIGKTTPNENIEVLTSYSNIDFSQLVGSYGNLNFVGPVTGQTIAFNKASNTWINTGGNALDPGNPTYYSNTPIHLGNVSNVYIGGGATGYILQTDGIGNLSWTTNGTLYSNIKNIVNGASNVITMTVDYHTAYTNQQQITISGVQGGNTTPVNGKTFYVKLDPNFANASGTGSGNVTLYNDLALTTTANGSGLLANANTGVATAVLSSGGGAGVAGGSTYSIQYNSGGIVTGDANFQWNYSTQAFSVTGTESISGNLTAGNLNTAGQLVSTVATGTAPLKVSSTTRVANLNVATSGVANTVNDATQPNITSTGTLSSLSVSGNANIGNIGTAGIVTSTGNITGGNLITAGLISATSNITGGNLITAGLISATSNITGGNLITGGVVSSAGNATHSQIISTVTTGTAPIVVTSTTRVANLNVATSGIANTVNDAAQPNITSVGTLTSLSVNGNLVAGNIQGNISGNITGNFSVNGSNTQVLFNDSGIANANAGLTFNKTTNALSVGNSINAIGNITGGNILTGGLISSSGNATHSQIISTVTTGTAPFVVTSTTQVANLNVATAGSAGSATTAGTVTTNAQPNITSVGTLNGLAIIGNLLLTGGGNLYTTNMSTGANTAPGNITGNWTLTAGSKLQATYADLAEYYEADMEYEPGTVLEFGGDKEVTLANDGTTRVAGVVTTNPAYVMNTGCEGIAVAIALQGRVPVKVRGRVRKGDMMVSAGNGFARPWNNPSIGMVIGKSLENFEGVEGIIEIAVGRL